MFYPCAGYNPRYSLFQASSTKMKPVVPILPHRVWNHLIRLNAKTFSPSFPWHNPHLRLAKWQAKSTWAQNLALKAPRPSTIWFLTSLVSIDSILSWHQQNLHRLGGTYMLRGGRVGDHWDALNREPWVQISALTEIFSNELGKQCCLDLGQHSKSN